MRTTLFAIPAALILAGCGAFDAGNRPQQEIVVTRGEDPRGASKIYAIDLDGETMSLAAGQTLRRAVPIGRYTLVATADPAIFDVRPVLDNVFLDRASLGFKVYADRPTVVEIETGPSGGPRLRLRHGEIVQR